MSESFLPFELVKPGSNPNNWRPVVGEFTEAYLSRLPVDQNSKDRILSDSAAILGFCSDPRTTRYSESGLVIGYVQSGKTMSFTTVTALARDNGYGLVIVLTGVTNLLRTQSTDRLADDLTPEEVSRDWKIFENPGALAGDSENSEYQEISRRLTAWARSDSKKETSKPSILVTLLKRASRIESFTKLLAMIDLSGVPTLIIDDESDQASPNTKTSINFKRGTDEESSTYASIASLVSTIPRCSMLQYTATPQANLLAAKVDSLAPSFSFLLEPGQSYTGAETFFTDNSQYVVEISTEEEVQSKNLPDEPPPSLEQALKVFWLGCAYGLQLESLNGKKASTHSMMVQVSQEKNPQSIFRNWCEALRNSYSSGLERLDSAIGQETISYFEEAHRELARTVERLPKLETLVEFLRDALEETRIVEVNSADNAEAKIIWKKSQFWVLVGGMKLDRGFTVKGITVTYMPRAVSENADTLQQRARFFGYHSEYLTLCRIYLTPSLKEAFVGYRDHEAFMRRSLSAHQGKNLSEWKRDFVLDPFFRRLTRANVSGRLIRKSQFKQNWLTPHFMHENIDAIEWNSRVMGLFVEYLDKHVGRSPNPDSWIDLRENGKAHLLYADVEVSLIQEFLFKLRFTNSKDSALMLGLEYGIERIKYSEPSVDVIVMNNLSLERNKGFQVTEREGLQNVFVGRSPDDLTRNNLRYIGDSAIHRDRPALQLRLVKISNPEFQLATGETLVAPWISYRVSKAMTTNFLLEDEK